MRKLFSIALTAISMVWSIHGAQSQEYGEYTGEVDARWRADGRSMELLADFSYLDPKGIRWDAPVGSVVDGASIPQFAWSIIGGPFEGKYRSASVIHDVACDMQKRPWQDVHKAFYTAMMASDVNSLKAKIMYSAVYHFGPRWTVIREIVQATSPEAVQRGCINLTGDMPTRAPARRLKFRALDVVRQPPLARGTIPIHMRHIHTKVNTYGLSAFNGRYFFTRALTSS
jgi:hypothetical protein